MRRRYKFGPAIIGIESERLPLDGAHPDLFYRFFDYEGSADSSVQLRLHNAPMPAPLSDEPTAQYPEQWNLYHRPDGGWRLDIFEPVHFNIKQSAIFDSSLTHADVYIAELPYHRPPGAGPGWMIVDLMEPLVQWWLTAWLALRWNGMVLHGSAVAWDETGMAFVGPSDAGKTTNARLFQEHGGAVVLNDERILIWREEDRWKVAGTPWHGELRQMSPLVADLCRLNFLHKSEENELVSIPPLQIVSAIAQEAFLPIWSAEAMTRLFDSIACLAEEPFCQKLVFRNDPSVVTFLKKRLEKKLGAVV